MRPDAPYFIILLCLMPDDFTHQVAMRPDAPYFIILLCLIPNDFTRKWQCAQMRPTLLFYSV